MRVARVDDHVVVGAAQHAEQLLDGARVRCRRTVGLLGPGQNLELGLVLRDQLPQKVAIEPVQIVDGVEHREAWAHAEEQRHLTEARLQVENQRRALRQAADLHRRVHRHRRGPGPALRAEEHERL